MARKTLDDMDLAGKVVLTRVDINVPVEDGRVTDATRIERIVPTVRDILDKGGKPVLLAHFGRPKGKGSPEMSLCRSCVPALEEALGRAGDVSSDDCVGPKPKPRSKRWPTARSCCWRTRASTRARKRTTATSRTTLAALGDVYVNDAFSAAHRAHASTEGWPGCCLPRPDG